MMDTLMELLQAQTGDSGQGGFTTQEVMGILGCSQDTARQRIKGLIISGKAEPARVSRVNMAGIQTKVVGYRLVD